jgi:hypothetical protein
MGLVCTKEAGNIKDSKNDKVDPHMQQVPAAKTIDKEL